MRYMRSEPRVTVRHDGDISIFDIAGYFTEDSAEGIDTAYDQSANAAKILLRFDRESFITSSGFGVIVKLIWQTRNRGQVLRVAHPSNQMRHIFDVIGVIVKLIWQTRNRGQVLRVAHPSNQMRHIFDVIGLSQSIDIFASEEKALADF